MIDTLKFSWHHCREIIEGIGNGLNRKYISESNEEIISNLETFGFHIIENFWSEEKCAGIRYKIDSYIEKNPNKIWMDSQHSDHRIFGMNQICAASKELLTSDLVATLFRSYISNQNPTGFVLGAKLIQRDGNLGSGGGWHRDSAHHRQLKFIIYLSDVSIEHGPFEYAPQSNRPQFILKGISKKYDSYGKRRYSASEVVNLFNHLKIDPIQITGKAGTLVVTDTRGLHRGHPINSDCRYALTTYLFKSKIPDHINQMLI